MLSPSDFNNAVPQFTNGDYASNPINPQYIAEPDAENYNRGTEPLQTLPAQWWNWFLNRFTNRFNKVNVYVKNIFNELAQVLSIFNITPDGTEQTPTTSQLKTIFECCYPQYVKTTANLVGTATTVNGHPLSSNVTVTRSDLGLGTSATVNTGTAAGCIPTVGTALGTTDGQFLATDANGKLKPSGYRASSFRASSWTPAIVCCAKCNGSGVAFGSAATCDASAFRPSTWTPSSVDCANYGKNGSTYSAFGSNAFNSNSYLLTTGCAADSAKLGGKTASVASAASTVVLRDANQYICASYFNSNINDEDINSYTDSPAIMFTSKDKWIRRTNKANLQTWLGLGSAAYANTSAFLGAKGCAADSAKLGGSTLASVRCGCWSHGSFGNVNWSRNPLTHQWTVNILTTWVCCDLFKAICCATDNFINFVGNCWQTIYGFMNHPEGGRESSYLQKASSTCVIITNCTRTSMVSAISTCTASTGKYPLSIGGVY